MSAAPAYTWHHDRDGWGTVLDAHKTGIGTYAEGYSVIVNGGITFAEAEERFGPGNVARFDQPIPVVCEVAR